MAYTDGIVSICQAKINLCAGPLLTPTVHSLVIFFLVFTSYFFFHKKTDGGGGGGGITSYVYEIRVLLFTLYAPLCTLVTLENCFMLLIS